MTGSAPPSLSLLLSFAFSLSLSLSLSRTLCFFLLCPLSLLLSLWSQGCEGGESIWQNKAGRALVPVWLLQEAQGKLACSLRVIIQSDTPLFLGLAGGVIVVLSDWFDFHSTIVPLYEHTTNIQAKI